MVDDENQEGGGIGQSASSPGTTGDGATKAGASKGGAALDKKRGGGGDKGKQEQEEEEQQEEEEELEEPDEEALGRMSALEKRLFKVRLKMNKVCRHVLCRHRTNHDTDHLPIIICTLYAVLKGCVRSV